MEFYTFVKQLKTCHGPKGNRPWQNMSVMCVGPSHVFVCIETFTCVLRVIKIVPKHQCSYSLFKSCNPLKTDMQILAVSWDTENGPSSLFRKHNTLLMCLYPFLMCLSSWCAQCACLRRFASRSQKTRPWNLVACTWSILWSCLYFYVGVSNARAYGTLSTS